MPRRSLVRVVAVALACALAIVALPASAGTPETDAAVDWLRSQQQPDGGFELAGGFLSETVDAALAIAADAQTGSTWSTSQARAAVGAAAFGFLDDEAEAGLCPGKAGKTIVLVAVPLGFDPRAYDPEGDGSPVDLVAVMDSAGGGSCFAAFSDIAYRVLADALLGRTVDPGDVAAILAGQRPDGTWDYTGDPTSETDLDVDTTALAVRALIAAGLSPHDRAVQAAVRAIAGAQETTGGWPSPFAVDDPNSTAMAMVGLTAAGHDVAGPCWTSVAGATPADALAARQGGDGRVSSPNDAFGVNTSPTSQAVQGWLASLLPFPAAPAQRCPDTGYRLAGADGGVFAFGTAGFHGSLGGVRLNQPIVGIASTPSGLGYWLVGADGGVFAFGDAGFHGSTGAIRLNQPIVGMAPTPTGLGYWLVAADGGIFAFGDAGFHGSTGAIVLNQPVVGVAASPGGLGYWLVAADGGIFAFGDAEFLGSTGAIVLNQPVTAMAPHPSGRGYWLVGADGGVFAFGTARFWGSLGTQLIGVVGLVASTNGQGYRYVTSEAVIGQGTLKGTTASCGCELVGMAP